MVDGRVDGWAVVVERAACGMVLYWWMCVRDACGEAVRVAHTSALMGVWVGSGVEWCGLVWCRVRESSSP